MIGKLKEREQAIKMREMGFSYSQILKEVNVAKSSLSLWLKDVGLSKRQRQRLTERKLAAIKRGGARKRAQRILKTEKIKDKSIQETDKLIKDPFWLTGVILYWTEGSKEKEWMPSVKTALTNMDPRVLKLFQKWLMKYCSITKGDIIYELYIHPSGEVDRARKFWSIQLGIRSDIIRVYFKKSSKKTNRKNINANYNGVISIRVKRSTDLTRKIAGWIDGVVKYLC